MPQDACLKGGAMNTSSFDTQVRAMHQRVHDLQERAANRSESGSELLPEALEDLHTTLEELRVAE